MIKIFSLKAFISGNDFKLKDFKYYKFCFSAKIEFEKNFLSLKILATYIFLSIINLKQLMLKESDNN